MRIAGCLAGTVGVAIIAAWHVASAADGRPEQGTLAQANRSVHRFSTSVKAQEMKSLFRNDETLDRAVAWCQQHGVTRIYLETFRFGYLVERPLLERVRDRFRQGGIETRGLVTPTMIGKPSTGWNVACCYSDLRTQQRVREIFEYTASFFDTILIDDFWSTDCACEVCSTGIKARKVTIGTRCYPVAKADWPHYRGELLCRLAEENVLQVSKAVKARKLAGIAAFKPAHGDPHGEAAIFSFLGMLGLPLNPCHTFPDSAPAACFASYLRSVPDAARQINAYIATGRPTLITDGLAQAL